MRIAGLIGSVVVVGALAACAHTNQPNAAAPQGYSPTSGVSCPLAQLTGVKAVVTDIDKGSAITFTAPKSEIDQLRDNVHAMADANDKQGDAFASCPCASGGRMGNAEQQGGNQGTLGSTNVQAPNYSAVKADSSVEEIPTGAILKLKAQKKGDVQTLRSEVRSNVDSLNRSCLR